MIDSIFMRILFCDGEKGMTGKVSNFGSIAAVEGYVFFAIKKRTALFTRSSAYVRLSFHYFGLYCLIELILGFLGFAFFYCDLISYLSQLEGYFKA